MRHILDAKCNQSYFNTCAKANMKFGARSTSFTVNCYQQKSPSYDAGFYVGSIKEFSKPSGRWAFPIIAKPRMAYRIRVWPKKVLWNC